MKYIPRLPKLNHNVSPVSPIKELVILLGGLLIIVVGIYILLGLSVELLVSRVSPETEMKLAELFRSKYDNQENQDKGEAYLQQLIDRMQEKECVTLPYPLTVHLVESEAINAMALPGGHILVLSGLLDIMQSENELFFVLGHEIGHFQNKDHLRGLGRGLVFATLSSFFLPSDSSVSRFIGKMVQVTESGFSREQETEADEFGLEVLHCGYGHVNGATHFFKHMPLESDPGQLGHYFSSHPENEKRINHLLELSEEKNYSIDPLTPLALPEQ